MSVYETIEHSFLLSRVKNTHTQFFGMCYIVKDGGQIEYDYTV